MQYGQYSGVLPFAFCEGELQNCEETCKKIVGSKYQLRVDNLRASQLVPLVFSQHKFESEVIVNSSNVHRAIAMYGYNDNCFVSIEGYSNMIRIKYDSRKMKQYQVVEIKKPHGFDNKYSSELTEILPEDKESTKMFKEISMIETKNINRATTMDELL